jgi:hypothetical protein
MLGIEAVLSTEEMANPVLVLIDKDLVHPIVTILAQDIKLCYKVPPVGKMFSAQDM